MMEDDGMILDNGVPNEELANVCNDLFFGNSDLAGNVGLKNLGFIVSAPNQVFESYLDGVNALVSHDDELSQ